MVARISDDYEPQFHVVGEDLPWPAARDVVASQVGAIRPLETVDQRIMAVGDGFRLPCSDSDDSDDDVLSVGPVRPLSTAASLGGARMDDACQPQADSLNDVLPEPQRAAMRRVVRGWMILIGWLHLTIWPGYYPDGSWTRSLQMSSEISVLCWMSFRSV